MNAVHSSSFTTTRVSTLIVLPLVFLSVLITCSCGGGVTSVAPSITAEPMALSTPVAQVATFTVTATGTAPLRFQWSRNGSDITGASNTSYTTPSVTPTDNGASFAVTVTNDRGSVNSIAASLTVLPRTPQMGDWRFQGMDLPAGAYSGSADLLSFQSFTLPNFIGTPLEVGLQFGWDCGSPGPLDCAWIFFGFDPAAGTAGPTSLYSNDAIANLDADLSGLANGNTVVRSLDLESANQIFAYGALQIPQGVGFEFSSQTVSPDQLQATTTQLGQQSRVVTALSYDEDGNVFVVSYGWQSDVSTLYSTQAIIIPSNSTDVATADSNAIIAAITKLANQGYIITAMGGDASNGLLLVGTRVQGDNLARPIEIFTNTEAPQGQVSSASQSLWGTVGGVTPAGTVQFSEQ